MQPLWKQAFSRAGDIPGLTTGDHGPAVHADSLDGLRALLDAVHIPLCLLRPYEEVRDYPLVEARELLPSFEADLTEYKELPGFSLLALARPLDHFREVFQYDILHPLVDADPRTAPARACCLEESVQRANLDTLASRLPKADHDELYSAFAETDVCALEHYRELLPLLLHMERGQVMALDGHGHFALQGVHASFPSDLDSELKRFGLRIGKFAPGDNVRYEKNRLFVYRFLMELHGFPIVSERRTSSALFARRLARMSERFLVRVLGQSDRTLTTLCGDGNASRHPVVDKTALVRVPANQTETHELLADQGFYVDRERRVVILRVRYQQHRYNPRNVHEDRALSVTGQEVVHPLTGRVMTGVNLIHDTGSMLLQFNDIVRGEHQGWITYHRNEIVRGTASHEERLKFLASWLSKHQRRLINYSDDFFGRITRVLDSYLLDKDNYEAFQRHRALHQEVWDRLRYITQARRVRALERLAERSPDEEALPYLETLRRMRALLEGLKLELDRYHHGLVRTALAIADEVLDDAYLHRTYLDRPAEELTDYGRDLLDAYAGLQDLVREIDRISRRQAEALGEPAARETANTRSET